MSHLLRVSLPDVPGSLGAVATAIGVAGANILAIEVVEHQPGGRAVDDVFVELLPGVMPDMVVSAVQRLDEVTVLWVSRYPTAGNLQLDLEAIEEISRNPGEAIVTLVRVVPRAFRADWAMVVVRRGSAVETVAVSEGAPELFEPPEHWFGLVKPARLDGQPSWDGWQSAVLAGAPVGSARRVVVIGRHGGPDVLASELARLGHLATLTASMEGPQAADDLPAKTVSRQT